MFYIKYIPGSKHAKLVTVVTTFTQKICNRNLKSIGLHTCKSVYQLHVETVVCCNTICSCAI
jgi:hypothetical protein